MIDKKIYTLTKEHKDQLKSWADKWIANTMSTKPMDDFDKKKMIEAVHGMYDSAKLNRPKHIVFVPSPMVLRLAGGFASWIWYLKNKKNKEATRDATADAIRVATSDATYAVTLDATREATSNATLDATRDATYDATTKATVVATRVATRDATDSATAEATDVATYVAISDATYDATYAVTLDATRDATYAVTLNAARDATYDTTADATRDATTKATYEATREATSVATSVATYVATREATSEATRDATTDATTKATYEATSDATREATADATYVAIYDATADATADATSVATDVATSDATRVATRDATYAVTLDAIRDATYDTTADATDEATVTKKNKNWFSISSDSILQIAKSIFKPEHVTYAIQCASRSWYMWVGGNQWSSWVAFLSFFRHVVKLDLNEYEKFKFYEDACIHGGPRIMHQDFCMISDRPEILLVDEQNRPHCDTGPFCKWRDGFSLYAIHGVRVPQYVVETPALIEIKDIENENNLEVKRVMIDRYGSDRYMQDSGAQLVQSDRYGELYVKPIQGDETITMVKVINSTPEPDGTNKIYWLRVPPNTPTAHAGVAWSFGLDVDQYNPMKET